MKNDAGSIGILKVGIPSMIIIFVGLCFTLMAAFAVSVAKSDYQLSLDLAQHVGEYYCAVNKAERRLADSEHLYKERNDNNQSFISIKMNEEQTLTILLQFQPNGLEGQILRYQIINEQVWEGDSSLPELLLPQS